MLYRQFPKIPNKKISTLGMGLMRLPVLEGDATRIDYPAAEAALMAAIDAGINYIDTAYVYHGQKSEVFAGDVLSKHGIRDKVYLATKCPVWMVQAEADWDRLLNEQLARLKTDRIDFYLMHALNAERWDIILKHRGLQFLERAKKEGRIGHIGFSFHAPSKVFKTIIQGYDYWDFCQVQYNYLDTEYQAGLAGIELAAERHVGVVVMEPLRGGALVRLPEPAKAFFDATGIKRSPADWGLRYALNHPNAITALSGMGKIEEVKENAATASVAEPVSLKAEEKKAFIQVAAWFKNRMPVPCTTCGYCMPCPHGVEIPDVFALYNGSVAFDAKKDRAPWYKKGYVDQNKGGNACAACGECLPKCPQGIQIIEKLAEAHEYLTT